MALINTITNTASVAYGGNAINSNAVTTALLPPLPAAPGAVEPHKKLPPA